MNERIKELAEQAGFETDRGPLIGPSPYIKVGGLCVGVPLEKFAELIVRECIGISDDYVKDCTCEDHVNCKHPRSAIGRKIREHFGVK